VYGVRAWEQEAGASNAAVCTMCPCTNCFLFLQAGLRLCCCCTAQFELNGGRPVANSIPATEHSVMTSWPNEQQAIENMIKHFGSGVFACVMDSYDYAAALSEVGLALSSCMLRAACMFICSCLLPAAAGPFTLLVPPAPCIHCFLPVGAALLCAAVPPGAHEQAACCPARCCLPSPARRWALAATWCCAQTLVTQWRPCSWWVVAT
jgi:hypothetical protein